MAKHASPSAHLQVVESPKSVAVQIPLPVLGGARRREECPVRPVCQRGPAGAGRADGARPGHLLRSEGEAGPRAEGGPRGQHAFGGDARRTPHPGPSASGTRRRRRARAAELRLCRRPGPVGSTHAGGDRVRRVDAQVRAEPRAALRGGGAEHLEERRLAAIRGAVPEADDGVAYQGRFTTWTSGSW